MQRRAAGAALIAVVVLAVGCGSPRAVRPTTTTARPATGPAPSTTAPPAASTPTTTSTTPPPPLPTVTIAGWTGRQPATIYFSADAGNVATGLTWHTWTATEAVGTGSRQELSCEPDCAQGAATTYPVTLTLSDPVDGSFTTLIEQTADGRDTSQGFTAPELAQGVCATDDEDSCHFAGA